MKRLWLNFDWFSLVYVCFFVTIFIWAFPYPLDRVDYIVYFHIGLAFGLSTYLSFYLQGWYLAMRKLNLELLICLRPLTIIWWMIILGYNAIYLANLWNNQLLKDIFHFFLSFLFVSVIISELLLADRVNKKIAKGNKSGPV